jgi:hypothetical protein
LSAHQIGRQRPQAHRIGPQPTVLDRDVLAFAAAGFVEAFADASTERAEALGEPLLINPTTGSAGCCARY